MFRAKIVNCKKASVVRCLSCYDRGSNQPVKTIPNGEIIEIDTNETAYDLKNRIYYRVYELGDPIGWIVSEAVEVKVNGK